MYTGTRGWILDFYIQWRMKQDLTLVCINEIRNFLEGNSFLKF